MELKNVEVLPGVVIVSDDPRRIGRVKAVVPTLFDDATMPEDVLPWIYPFTMSGYQSYSKPRNGMKIWVINNKDNYNEYWYMPMFELANDTKYGAVSEDDEVDVLMGRNMCGGTNTIYHSQDSGFVTQLGEYKQQLSPDGSFTVDGTSGMHMAINNNSTVTLGKKGEANHAAVRGDKLVSMLKSFTGKIKEIALATSNGDQHLWNQLNSAAQEIDNQVDGIISDSVYVD